MQPGATHNLSRRFCDRPRAPGGELLGVRALTVTNN